MNYGYWNYAVDIIDRAVSFRDVDLVDGGDPVLLWWTGFTGELGSTKSCGEVSCFVTVKRKYLKENHAQVSKNAYSWDSIA